MPPQHRKAARPEDLGRTLILVGTAVALVTVALGVAGLVVVQGVATSRAGGSHTEGLIEGASALFAAGGLVFGAVTAWAGSLLGSLAATAAAPAPAPTSVPTTAPPQVPASQPAVRTAPPAVEHSARHCRSLITCPHRLHTRSWS